MFNIIDIIVLLIIAISVFFGYKKGFVKTVISLLSFFIAIGVSLMFYKPFAIILTENTTIDDWIIEHVTSNYEEKSKELESGDAIFVNNSTFDEMQNGTNKSDESKKEISQEKIESENNSNIFNMLPANITNTFDFETIKQETKLEIAYKISELIMNLLSLIIIYIVVKVTLVVATFVLDGIMKFPILKQLNEILGMVIGAVIGFIQVYLAFAVITFISSISDISIVIEAIKVSAFASVLFENNLIINLLF